MGLRARIRLGQSLDVYEPTVGQRDRISFAWHDEDGAVSMPAKGGCASTVVLVWPTDRRGFVDPKAIQRCEIRAAVWTLTPEQLDRIDYLGKIFPLHQHDFLVRPERIVACARTARTMPFGLPLDRLIDPVIVALSR